MPVAAFPRWMRALLAVTIILLLFEIIVVIAPIPYVLSRPEFGTLAQWITAGIALGVLIAAGLSIRSQREIARKRAAIDFFIKTEMDKEVLDAHGRFTFGINALNEHKAKDKDRAMEEFAKTEYYHHVRSYLNLHELMAVEINEDVFDDNVCYSFWSGELHRACRDTAEFVDFVQRDPDDKNTYIELFKVNSRWADRA